MSLSVLVASPKAPQRASIRLLARGIWRALDLVGDNPSGLDIRLVHAEAPGSPVLYRYAILVRLGL